MGFVDIKSKKPAVFLDRDGVLTKEKGYVTSVKELEIFPFVKRCIAQIHEKGYYAIVVTNQSGVARGLFTEKALKKMNGYLMEQISVDAVYYCPHHPEGKREIYRGNCHCRKPETGMFDMACQEFKIDMKKSYIIGDRAGDIMMGERAGLKTILVESGYDIANFESDVIPGYIVKDLRNVIEIID